MRAGRGWRGLELVEGLGEATQGQEPEQGGPHYFFIACSIHLLPHGLGSWFGFDLRRRLKRGWETQIETRQTKQSWFELEVGLDKKGRQDWAGQERWKDGRRNTGKEKEREVGEVWGLQLKDPEIVGSWREG